MGSQRKRRKVNKAHFTLTEESGFFRKHEGELFVKLVHHAF